MWVLIHGRLPPLRDAVAGADCIPPPLGVQDTLPWPITAPWRPAPHERDTATFREVGNQAFRNRITVEPMECVAHGDEVEDPLKRHGPGRGGNPFDVGDSETLRFALAELDRFRFLVNGQDLGDVRRQCERHLAGAIGKVEQLAGAVKRDAGSEIVEQHCRVGGRNRS